jgi:hypothetical protein
LDERNTSVRNFEQRALSCSKAFTSNAERSLRLPGVFALSLGTCGVTINSDGTMNRGIGADAVEYAAKGAEALAASDEKWRDLSISTGEMLDKHQQDIPPTLSF